MCKTNKCKFDENVFDENVFVKDLSKETQKFLLSIGFDKNDNVGKDFREYVRRKDDNK